MTDRETDREMLERAAEAAGYVVVRWTDDGTALLLEGVQQPWNPLIDDGDALRLAVKLRLGVQCYGWRVDVCRGSFVDVIEYPAANAGDDLAATRRAIVRAAAAVGEQMQEQSK